MRNKGNTSKVNKKPKKKSQLKKKKCHHSLLRKLIHFAQVIKKLHSERWVGVRWREKQQAGILS